MIFYFLFLLLGLYFFNHFYWKRRNLPPGPIPIPFFGNILQIASDPPGYSPLLRWRKQYGEVYTYWMGNLPIVAVADYKLIQETFVKDGDSYSGRKIVGNLIELIKGGNYGIVFINGDYWKEQRRFGLQVLRNLGMGRNILEEKILIEIDNLVLSLEREFAKSKNSEHPHEIEVDIAEEIEITVASVINQMLFGFSYNNPEEREEFGKLKNLLSDHMAKAISPTLFFIATISSVLRFVPPFKEAFEEYKSQYEFFLRYFDTQIEKHLKDQNENEEIQDFTDAYLREIIKNTDGFNKKQLLNVLSDLWIAGQETTSNTIIFGILYAIHFPETQKKIHNELEEKVNSSRRITLEDKNDLPYIQAFICEVQRFVNLLAMNLFHVTTRDVTIQGHRIPEGTCIIPQISNVLYDEKCFENPMTFNPERFLDANGNFKKMDELIPFSVGKRQCLGESMAKMELFLIFSNLFNRYKIKPVSEDNLPSLNKKVGITVQPEKFTCVLEKKFR